MKKLYFSFVAVLLISISFAYGQLPGSRTYDFRDGTLITAGQSDDASLKLSGTYSLHGAQYGLNMKVGGEIKITVAGSSTIKFLGSAYSSLSLTGTASTEGDLGTQLTKVTNDLSDTFDFVYFGAAATLTFKTVAPGSDLYLPLVEVIAAQAGGDESLTSAANNIIYYFDLRDGSIIPNETSLNGNYTIEKGLFKVESGPSNGYGYNGTQHGSILKTGNKITLKVGGNSTIKIGGSIYSNGTISVSSATGDFDMASQASQTTGNFGNDGSTVDFLYAGTAGTVVLDFTGTTYIPYIVVVPVPYPVVLTPWVKKSGTITVNGIEINLTSGDTSTDNATVTVSDGTVVSATAELASIRINLGGAELASYTPALSGDIASVTVNQDTLKITYSAPESNPQSYAIIVADNSTIIHAEAGKTYSYNLADGSVLPQTGYAALRYTTFTTTDGIATLNSNTDTESLQYGYHDAAHGAVFFPGNSIDMIVAGNATVTFITCTYGSATDAVFEFKNSEGTVLGSTSAQNIGLADGGASSFTYTGPEGVLTATLNSPAHPTAEIYIHGFSIENAAAIDPSNGLTDVWDFGAVQLDNSIYNNNLTVDIINSWYAPTITVGSSGNVLPSFTAGVLSWVGGGNDRLRTTNTEITRYDQNIASAVDYTGRVYVNSSAASGRYMSLTLSEDDEVTIIARTDAGGKINFQYVADPTAQTDVFSVSDLDTLKFVAKAAGTYHIFDTQGKPSYFRIYRKDATYVNLAGAVDVTEASGIPDGYAIAFTNEAGKTWTSTMAGGGYTAKLPAGYTYKLSLTNANGYIISNGFSFEVTESTTTHDVVIKKLDLYTVNGSITGLGSKVADLSLVYTPDASANKIFKPEPVVDADAGTYTVQLEPNCLYTISAMGVNDFYLSQNTITIGMANETADLAFEAKSMHQISIDAPGLTAEQLAKLNLTFTNLNEAGYAYSFTSVDAISLRDGTYSVSASGLDDYPLQLGLTSNLKVDGADASKTLDFGPVTNWSFEDKAIPNGTASYKGLMFTGTIASELAKGHLTAKPDATIQIPANPGDKIRITYYYSADFSIDGGAAITTSSGSTSTLEYANYSYPGNAAGFVTITVGSGAGTTYITDITETETVAFKSVITVGTDKNYQTINEALLAIGKMERPDNERVTVMIDPGNYEEMLVINSVNVTLKNAAASPSIALMNKGIDIAEGAVRITSYYGHGYNYYSMGSNQKWNADILRVNKENSYLSYENKGAGTTNGSYWNATVVVAANGFEADDIIFENSYNQYISKKESEDVIEMWESGNKGLRPTDYGNTTVQNKSFIERAAAIAITNNTDQTVLTRCRVVGRQDSFFGGSNCRVVIYKGSMMGGTDYLFGGMVAVFYKSKLAMNTSDDNSDVSYITAAQQSSGRGYLMYECVVTSANPGTETASAYRSKPGYFGRPWQATTSEVVFYNTKIETTDFTGMEGQSLIVPIGWLNSLGGESNKMYEYGTIELSGANNSSARAGWSTLLSTPSLTDATEITTFNFTKGTDNWDPIPDLIANDIPDGVSVVQPESDVHVYALRDRIYVSGIQSKTRVNVYSITGSLVKTLDTTTDTNFNFMNGLWIVKLNSAQGEKAVKVLIR
ncbi:MAG: pectinesterase family protein [Prolixibacteraceae bacterium]|jgi:hypothetical protein